jgi:hypothetical protein
VLEKPLNRGKIDDAFTVFSEHFVILAQASRANAKFVEGSLVMEKVDILGPSFLGRVGFDRRVALGNTCGLKPRQDRRAGPGGVSVVFHKEDTSSLCPNHRYPSKWSQNLGLQPHPGWEKWPPLLKC